MTINLKRILDDRHWSIETVSRYAGISRTTLTNMYYGRSKGILLETLEKLCNFLELTPNDLLEYQPNMANRQEALKK